MKIPVLFSDYRPNCPKVPLLDILNPIAPIGQAIGGVVSSIISSNAMKKANAQNVAMQKETNDLQYQMMKEQNAWNRQQAIDMFNLEASYNSPLSQMQRLKDAGLNPAVAFGQNVTTTSGNSNASTPAAVGVPTPQAPRVSPVPSPVAGVFDQISQNVLNVSQALVAASQAKKTTAETKRIYTLLDQELKNMQTAGQNQQIEGNILKIKEDLEQLNFEVKSQTQYKQEYAIIEKLAAETTLAIAQGKTEEAESRLKNFQALTQEKEYRILLAKAPLILQEMEEGIKLLKEKQKTEKANQAAAYGAAALSTANASTINALRESVVRASEADAKTKEKQYSVFLNTMENKVIQSDQITELQRANLLFLKERLEKAKKENKWYEVMQLQQLIVGSISAFVPFAPGAPASSAPSATPYVPSTPTYSY